MADKPESLAESVRRFHDFREACSHAYSSWEYNPNTHIYSRRCPRCGNVLETMTKHQMDKLLGVEDVDGA